MKILRTLLNAGFVIMLMLMMMLRQEITFISQKDIEGLRINDCNIKVSNRISVVFHKIIHYGCMQLSCQGGFRVNPHYIVV